MTMTYLEWLQAQLILARTELAKYQLRNRQDENGANVVDDYCDQDWSGLFASEATVDTLEACLYRFTQELLKK